jgi:NAD(P)-dependent dehydrogenase (short-subunit alcohol dehydrogenase family)
MSNDFSLEGKAAIVTGGGRGIGRAIAMGLAEAGCDVAVCSRTPAEIEAAAKEIEGMGRKSFAQETDITDSQQLQTLINRTVEEFGKIDILVNNSARSFLRPLMELREDGYDKIMDTNVKALFMLSRECAKIMKEQGGGRIINITTVGAERGGKGLGVYHASKACVKMLTMCMAVEWAEYNINVNCVGPGLTRTEFSRPIWENPDMAKRVASTIPKGRIAEPEEIVGAVIYLASDASSFVTGQSIYVDGGSMAS